MELTKRGFLKLGAALVGGVSLMRYAEPAIALPEPQEWIEDRGDFFIIRIPDGKELVNELIAKPAIILLGAGAELRRVWIDGFANLMAPKGGILRDCSFDGSTMSTESARPVLLLRGSSHLSILGGMITGNEKNSSGIDFSGCRMSSAVATQPQARIASCYFG